jgi:hypothetical protein
MPIARSVPIPAASSPGITTSGTLGPPIPVASIISIAAINGETNRNETAANAPAAPISVSACGGVSRRASPTISTARPGPSASSGASGPSTIPKPIPIRPANSTPGSSTGVVGLPVARPLAGMWPPFPGR